MQAVRPNDLFFSRLKKQVSYPLMDYDFDDSYCKTATAYLIIFEPLHIMCLQLR